jgi:hypothetical protein
MSRRSVLRVALWTAAFFNLAGAYPFAFPNSALGEFAGLPPQAPIAYRAMTALFVLLFGGAYAWLAAQPTINRPFVAFGAIGKAAAFATVVVLWLSGAAPVNSVLAIVGDLLLALLFAWCLIRPVESATSTQRLDGYG